MSKIKEDINLSINKIDPTLAIFFLFLSSEDFKMVIKFFEEKYIPILENLSNFIPKESQTLSEEIIKKYNVPPKLSERFIEQDKIARILMEELKTGLKLNNITCMELKIVEKMINNDDGQQYRFGNNARQIIKIIINHDFDEYSLEKSLGELKIMNAASEVAKEVIKASAV